jgi:hypothetical protein
MFSVTDNLMFPKKQACFNPQPAPSNDRLRPGGQEPGEIFKTDHTLPRQGVRELLAGVGLRISSERVLI